MEKKKVYRAIGLMSGTSLDGVDAALIETDGFGHVRPLSFVTLPYDKILREQIRACFGMRDVENLQVVHAAAALTRAHIKAIKALGAGKADIIGFHGQTIFHAPKEGLSLQIGDGALMAAETGIDVIDDFRTADVKAGGEGAPLAPLYHWARAGKLETPVAIVNIGGVSNVTWIGAGAHEILAFDCGPGNALMDDWARARTGALFDEDGALAAKGQPLRAALDEWLAHEYFVRKPPKSLDRDQWDIAALGRLAEQMGKISTEDGAATLMAFTAETIVNSTRHMPEAPKAWYVCGGGRRNKALMAALAARLPKVELVEALGWNGDATEAECFAYLAVRSLLGEAISLPTTTGVSRPLTGGRLHKA